jgi:hypothetical protein
MKSGFDLAIKERGDGELKETKTMNIKKRLPIGIQTFEKIIDGNFLYVDKTDFALKLVEGSGYYFLSRPRRFGKSLFLDTLAEVFMGNRELFKGLYIYDRYDFKKYPIIRISFGSGDFTDEKTINKKIDYILKSNEEELNLKCKNQDNEACFAELIKGAYAKYNQKTVILIDEYDKPILDNITNQEMALKARHILKNFYAVIKDSDRYIRFVFITGVSKFSKINLFSGLNNLEDITVNKDYAEICGYTHEDLKSLFREHLKGADLNMVKRWYNGYYYFGEKVYNPFDILLFISNGHEFRNYWWNTGNPSFLIEKLREENYYIPDIEQTIISEEALNAFDVEYIDLLALLWQTGYLTFEDKIADELGVINYKLRVPNLEIQLSLNHLFIDYLTNERHKKLTYRNKIKEALKKKSFDQFIEVLKTIFASIPYHNYAKNIIANYEGYYSSVVFVYLSALGYEVIPEDTTNRGRIDLTLKLDDKTVIIEFKVDSDESPIKQIKEKKYYEKYLNEKKDIYLIGINFDSRKKNIVKHEAERLEGYR